MPTDTYENEGPHGIRRKWRDLGDGTYAPSVYDERASGAGSQVEIVDSATGADVIAAPAAGTEKGLAVHVISQPAGGAGTVQYAEDTAATAGESVVMVGAVRKDARASLVDADGDRAELQVNANGELRIKHDDVQPVSGTVAVSNFPGTQPVSGTVDTELTTADLDTGAGTDTRAVVGIVGSKSGGGVLIPGDATAGLKVDLGTDNDVTVTGTVTVQDGGNVISVDDGAGSLTVDGSVSLAAAIPAGTNNIGDVDVLTINGQAPAFNSGVRGATVQRVTIATDDIVPVTGTLAHDAVDSGNPAKIGGKVIAAAGTPSFVSATGDRADAAFDSAGRLMIMEPVAWTASHAPAANTQATASKAAGGTGVKHVLTSLFVQCHNSGAATAAVLIINVRDGASGAGTVLWTLRLPIAATTLTSNQIFLNDLSIIGSAATAMTVEFSAAGGANTNEIVNIAGYDTV